MVVPPSVPEPLKVRFALLLLKKRIELPEEPFIVAVMITVDPDRTPVAAEGMSAFTAVTILVAAVVELVPTATSPVLARVAAQVNVCEPITNVWPIVPAADTVIVP